MNDEEIRNMVYLIECSTHLVDRSIVRVQEFEITMNSHELNASLTSGEDFSALSYKIYDDNGNYYYPLYDPLSDLICENEIQKDIKNIKYEKPIKIRLQAQGKTFKDNHNKKNKTSKIEYDWESNPFAGKLERKVTFLKNKKNSEKDVEKNVQDLRKQVDKLKKKLSDIRSKNGRGLKPEGDFLVHENWRSRIIKIRDSIFQDSNIGYNPELEIEPVRCLDNVFDDVFDALHGSFSDTSRVDFAAIFTKVSGYFLAISSVGSYVDFVKISLGVLSQHASGVHFQYLTDMWNHKVEPQGFDISVLQSSLSSIKNTLSSFEDIPVYKIISQVTSLLIFTGMKPSTYLVEDNFLKCMVEESEERIKRSPFDAVLTFVSLSETIVEILDVYRSGGDIVQMLLPTTLHQRIAEVKAKKQSVLQGTYRDLFGQDPSIYEAEVRKLTRELAFELRRRDIPGRLKPIYEQYYTQIIKIGQDLEVMNQTCRVREAPCTLMIYGPSNIGKSSITSDCIGLFGRVTGVDVSDEFVYDMSDRDKFDSKYRQDKTVITIDDMSNIKPDKIPPNEMTVARTIDIINNAVKYSVQPEAEDKGKIQFKPKLVIATTNVETLNASFVSCEPYSVLRRWLFMEVRIKKEFSIGGAGKELDKVKANEYNSEVQPPLNEGRIFIWVKEGNAPHRAYINGDSTFKCVSLLYPTLSKLWLDERDYQRKYVERMTMKDIVKYCDVCHNPATPEWCHCSESKPKYEPQSFLRDPKIHILKDFIEDVKSGTCNHKWYKYVSSDIMRKKIDPLGYMTQGEVDTVTEVRVCIDSAYKQCLRNFPGKETLIDDIYSHKFDDPVRLEQQSDVLINYVLSHGLRQLTSFFMSMPSLNYGEYVGMSLLRFTALGFKEFWTTNYSLLCLRCFVVSVHCGSIWLSSSFCGIGDPYSKLVCSIIHWLLSSGVYLLPDKFYYYVARIVSFMALISFFESVLGFHIVAFAVSIFLAFFYYAGIVSFSKLALSREIRNARSFGDIRLYDGLMAGAGILTALSLIRTCWKTFSAMNAEGNLLPSSLGDIRKRQDEKNDWLKPEVVRLDAIKEVRSMSFEQVANRVKVNLVRFVVTSSGTPLAKGAAQIVATNVIMIPYHVWRKVEGKDALRIDVVRKPQCLTALTKDSVIEQHYRIPDHDFVLLRLSKSFSVISLIDFLPEQPVSGEICSKLLLKRDDTELDVDVVFRTAARVFNGEHTQRGGHYYMKLDCPTMRGDCMSPIVSKTSPHLIIGFHCGGDNLINSAGFTLLRSELKEALLKLSSIEVQGRTIDVDPAKHRAIVHFVGIDDVSPLSGEIISKFDQPIHERSCVNFVSPADEGVPPSCEVGGFDASFRVTPHSDVVVTPLSAHLAACGWPRLHGPPKFKSDRQHATYFQIGVRGMRDVDETALIEASRDYVASVVGKWDLLDYPDIQILSIDETLNGRKGCRWIKQMDEHTSAGVGLPGKKVAYLKIEFEEDGRKHFVLNPELVHEVYMQLSKLRSGQLLSPLVKTALKDEPTKLTNPEKVRVFSVFPMCHFLVGKMLFAPILAALYDIPLNCEMLQGCNVTTDDWSQIREHLVGFNPDMILEGDFSKFDVNLSGQVIRTVGSILASFSDFLGYSREEQLAVYTYVADIASNPWIYNGTLFCVDKWNPSGNYLTIAINGIANCLLHRLAYFKIGRDVLGMRPPRFQDGVHLGTVGDDSGGSTKFGWYNMVNISQYFDQLNISYTDGQKTGNIQPFQNLEDFSICKRKFLWNEYVQQYVAPLDIDSIGKMLHCQRVGIIDDDTLARGNLLVALRELARHEKNVFEERVEIIRLALISSGKEYLLPEVELTYSAWWEILAQDFPVVALDIGETESCIEAQGDILPDASDVSAGGFLEDLGVYQLRHPLSGERLSDIGIEHVNLHIETEGEFVLFSDGETIEFYRMLTTLFSVDIAILIDSYVGDLGFYVPMILNWTREGYLQYLSLESDVVLLQRWRHYSRMLRNGGNLREISWVDIMEDDHFGNLFVESRASKSPQKKIPVKNSRRRSGYQRGRNVNSSCLGLASCVIALSLGSTNPLPLVSNKNWITENNYNITTTKEEVMGVTFSSKNATPSWSSTAPTANDPSMDQGMKNVSNDTFFERPVKIFEQTWVPGAAPISQLINPWAFFLFDPRVQNRICHYKYIRGKMKVTIMINGNPFYYGRMLVSYVPLPGYDYVTVCDTTLSSRIQASQRQHVTLDPTMSQGGELNLPFIYPLNAVTVANNAFGELGVLHVTTLNTLRHANGASDPISIVFLASMYDVELIGPTITKPPVIFPQGCCVSGEVDDDVMCGDVCSVCCPLEPQGDEYGKISGPAHTLANWSGYLADAPYIGVYARATQIAATAIGNVASLFGFSRPNSLIMTPMLRRTCNDWSSTNREATARTLSLDCKKEITIDPRVVGAEPIDHMALLPLAQRESLLATFTWLETNPTGQWLFQDYVTPLQGDAVTVGAKVTMAPSAWIALPYTYWTGSMEMRIQVVASKFHRGRLRVSWDPVGFATNLNPGYNLPFTQIIDIGESCDAVVKIGWGQARNYLDVYAYTGAVEFPSYAVFNGGLGPLPDNDFRCNGMVQISVMTPLTSASASTDPVEVNVYTKFCDDFEVNAPSSAFTSRILSVVTQPTPLPLGYSPPSLLAGPVVDEVVDPVLEPQGNLFEEAVSYLENIPGEEDAHYFLGFKCDSEEANQVYFGELCTSWRQLLKRYATLYTYRFTTTNDIHAFKLSAVPFSGTLGGVLKAPDSLYHDYISKAYLTVRGSGRYSVTSDLYTGTVAHATRNSAMQNFIGVNGVNTALSTDLTARMTGSCMEIPAVTGYIEFEVPSYSNLRFIPARSIQSYSELVQRPFADFWWKSTTSATLRFAWAAGEDYSLTTFVSTPPVTISAPPVLMAQGDMIADTDPSPDENCPGECPPDFQVGFACEKSGANHVFFGEQCSSWRQLLKRYVCIYQSASTTANAIQRWDLPAVPYQGTLGTTVTRPGYILHDFISKAYLTVRGSGRYSVTTASQNTGVAHVSNNTRVNQFVGVNGGVAGSPDDIEPKVSGSAHETTAISGYIEFEVPSYSNTRFIPTRSLDAFGNYVRRPFAAFFFRGTSAHVLKFSWSAGEDYSLAHFISVPVVTIGVPS